MATGPPPAPEMAGLQVPTASLTTRAGNVEAAGSLRVHNIPNPARFATNNSDALSQSVWSRKCCCHLVPTSGVFVHGHILTMCRWRRYQGIQLFDNPSQITRIHCNSGARRHAQRPAGKSPESKSVWPNVAVTAWLHLQAHMLLSSLNRHVPAARIILGFAATVLRILKRLDRALSMLSSHIRAGILRNRTSMLWQAHPELMR